MRELDGIAERARDEGLVARYGRKILEVLPPVGSHKGTAVRRLLEERDLRRALAAGDDTTDLDSFAALEGSSWRSGLRSLRRGAAALLDAADLVVASTGSSSHCYAGSTAPPDMPGTSTTCPEHADHDEVALSRCRPAAAVSGPGSA